MCLVNCGSVIRLHCDREWWFWNMSVIILLLKGLVRKVFLFVFDNKGVRLFLLKRLTGLILKIMNFIKNNHIYSSFPTLNRPLVSVNSNIQINMVMHFVMYFVFWLCLLKLVSNMDSDRLCNLLSRQPSPFHVPPFLKSSFSLLINRGSMTASPV